MSDTLQTSDSIAALAPALVALQHALPKIEKDATSHHGKYADLAGTLDAIKGAVHDAGFAIVQPASGGQGGFVSVTTILLHTSGEWLRDTLTMPTGGNGAQGVGSAITYARRYALSAMLSLAADDDDGASASQPQAPQRAPRAPRQSAPPPPPLNSGAGPGRQQDDPELATDTQVRLLAIQCTKAGVEEAQRIKFVSDLVGRPIASTRELSKREISKAIDDMKVAT